MKKCILVWQIPTIEGEHYNPVMYAIYIRKARKFANMLNEYFKGSNMDWECILDKSACNHNEIFSNQYQLAVFVPGAETRQWLYKKDLQIMRSNTYYLDYMEYNSINLDKLIKFIEKIF